MNEIKTCLCILTYHTNQHAQVYLHADEVGYKGNSITFFIFSEVTVSITVCFITVNKITCSCYHVYCGITFIDTWSDTHSLPRLVDYVFLNVIYLVTCD